MSSKIITTFFNPFVLLLRMILAARLSYLIVQVCLPDLNTFFISGSSHFDFTVSQTSKALEWGLSRFDVCSFSCLYTLRLLFCD